MASQEPPPRRDRSSVAVLVAANLLPVVGVAFWGWQVQDDIKEGHNRGVKEIPAFFINDVQLTLKPTYANISAAIDAALKKSKSKSAAKKSATKSKQRA